jgi:hypothetical protein
MAVPDSMATFFQSRVGSTGILKPANITFVLRNTRFGELPENAPAAIIARRNWR